MNKKHWLIRCSAILLVFAMLTLSGCGSKPKTPAETSATTAPTKIVVPSTFAGESSEPTGSTSAVAPTDTLQPTASAAPTESTAPAESTKATAATKATTAKPSFVKPALTVATKATTATKPAQTKVTVPPPTTPAATVKPTVVVSSKAVKNVIFMIADGGGYDNFSLANKVKQTMQTQGISKLAGAKTQITSNALSGLGKNNVSGLYLNEMLVGSANTLLTVNHGAEANYKSYITDSAAAGTALATGYKTQYTYLGLDEKERPRASITELARMNGMATGLVTTKSYMDATPPGFLHQPHHFPLRVSGQQLPESAQRH